MEQKIGPLRVMLVDDHALVRSAVRQAITASDVELVGEAATAAEALALAPVLKPDILLLDIDLPGMNGVQLVQELAPRLPLTRTSPVSGASRPRIKRIVVDFPAPFGPTKPVTRPGRTRNDSPSTATVFPYRFARPCASIVASTSVKV